MAQSKRIIPHILFPGLIAGVYVFIVCYALGDYIAWRSPGFLLGIAAIPMVMIRDAGSKKSLRFYYAALACCVLAWIVPAKTLLYLSLVMALCFLADSAVGRINFLPLLAMLLMAPVCDYITQIFTFPIRLQLTEWAGSLLQIVSTGVTVEGNTIFHRGNEFAVDAACMGLNMMVASMLCCIMLLGFYQKRLDLRLSFPLVAVLLAFTAALNIFSNLFRIILLVQFAILPDHPMHDVTGIICLAVYVILPLLILVPFLVKRLGKPHIVKPGAETDPHMITMAHICLAGCVFLVAYKIMLPDARPSVSVPDVTGYQTTVMDNGRHQTGKPRFACLCKTCSGILLYGPSSFHLLARQRVCVQQYPRNPDGRKNGVHGFAAKGNGQAVYGLVVR
ncbi:exosortase N [Chitinophaga sp. XS-30]|uniref:exosortase N n=1 Tax=Chitinophaga sp. XS-30 TaxID=2604421 RepID=UPI00143DDC7D|nr:exosortase N [Chitinophaga sp. XS-30]